jgi:hypothetical protein
MTAGSTPPNLATRKEVMPAHGGKGLHVSGTRRAAVAAARYYFEEGVSMDEFQPRYDANGVFVGVTLHATKYRFVAR